MADKQYDFIIIGAGAAGLIAAEFAVQLGARVAPLEKDRIGGDCTWTGCIPSKALLKVAKIAHEVRLASTYGIQSSPPVINMSEVRACLRSKIQQVYAGTTPEALKVKGMDVFIGPTRFLDAWTVRMGEQTLRSKKFLIATGARPILPPIVGISEIAFSTYQDIFDNDRLPESMIVVGGGPVGLEIAQAYQRLGARVTVVADRLLSKEDTDVRELMRKVLEGEGIRFLWGELKNAGAMARARSYPPRMKRRVAICCS